MLGIGAVIGAGIFSAIGTAAVGEVAADGTVIRYGAGPALVLSFVLLGVVCALAGLCYAELAAMIPIAGSAYTYAYATLGELVAWIIGWDLILEYAVGNVAVAIAWSGYFSSLLRFFGIDFPFWLSHGYRDVLLSYPESVGGRCPYVLGHHDRGQPAGDPRSSALITWLLVHRRARERAVNNVMVVLKLAVLALFVGVGALLHRPANWTPFAPNGWRGHPPGRGDRLLRLHRLRRDLDRGRGDQGPAAEHAARHPRVARHLHAHLRDRGPRGDRARALPAAQGRRPAGARLRGGRDRLGPGDHLLRARWSR